MAKNGYHLRELDLFLGNTGSCVRQTRSRRRNRRNHTDDPQQGSHAPHPLPHRRRRSLAARPLSVRQSDASAFPAEGPLCPYRRSAGTAPRPQRRFLCKNCCIFCVLSSRRDAHAALATVVFQAGSAPRGAGSRLLAGPKGLLGGTTGGGLAEARVIEGLRQGLRNATVERCVARHCHGRHAGRAFGNDLRRTGACAH